MERLKNKRTVLIDDTETFNSFIGSLGECSEYAYFNDPEKFLNEFNNQFTPDFIILDREFNHRKETGLDFLIEIVSKFPNSKVIVVSGNLNQDHIDFCISNNAQAISKHEFYQ